VDERQLEDSNQKLRQALLRILHYPLPRSPSATPPTVTIGLLRDAIVQMQWIEAYSASCFQR